MAKKPDLLSGTLDMLIFENADARTAAWLRHCAFDQAALRRCVDGGGRLALSGVAATPASGLGEGRMEDDRDEPARSLLQLTQLGANNSDSKYRNSTDDRGDWPRA